MYVNKNFKFSQIIQFTGFHIVWITCWAVIVTIFHEVFHHPWLAFPWLPVSIIATALAFYIGFKNNQAYDRLWEARKIWGAIINTSRAFGTSTKAFVSNHFRTENISETEINTIVQRILYRHIAWLYALRSQLLIPTPWEHISQGGMVGKTTKKRYKKFGKDLVNDEITMEELHRFLPKAEYDQLINYKNTATQIIDYQSQDFKQLREHDIIEDFRHLELQNLLNELYVHQGKAERIKKFPLPRQYGSMSQVFIGIFIFLLPFGMVTEFHKLGEFGPWLSIPFTVLVAWVYMVMELVGDYSENPFEGLGNDIPMHSLCRVIEIDLREMLGEKDLPPAIQAVNGVLM